MRVPLRLSDGNDKHSTPQSSGQTRPLRAKDSVLLTSEFGLDNSMALPTSITDRDRLTALAPNRRTIGSETIENLAVVVRVDGGPA